MANRTNLGLMLGELLSGATNQNGRQRGYLDGMRGLEAGSNIELNQAKVGETEADTAIKKKRLDLINAAKNQAINSLGYASEANVPVDRMPDVFKSLASIENAYGRDDKSFDLAKQLSQIQRNNLTQNITPDNAFNVSKTVYAMDGKSPLDILQADMANGLRNDGKANANERGLLYSQGKTEYSNLGSDGTFNQITGSSQINPQAIKPKEAANPQWDSARGVFVSPDGTVTEPRLPDGGKLPSKEASKPLPSTALKMQNEGLDKLTVARNIEKDLNEFGKLIDDGKLDFGIVSNLMNKAKNNLGMSDEESRNLASFQATMEKLRNDSLRLNSGVQTEGDAQRAWNELFTNINDPKLVRDRLNEIVSINRRAADLQKLNIDNIRANYNADPLDYSQYESMPTFKGEAKPSSAPKGKQVKRTGKTKDGRRVVEYSDGTREYQ